MSLGTGSLLCRFNCSIFPGYTDSEIAVYPAPLIDLKNKGSWMEECRTQYCKVMTSKPNTFTGKGKPLLYWGTHICRHMIDHTTLVIMIILLLPAQSMAPISNCKIKHLIFYTQGQAVCIPIEYLMKASRPGSVTYGIWHYVSSAQSI